MRIEVIELLRCPAAHESSPLVTVAIRRDGDRLIEATLGCAVCRAEYLLRDGIAYLGGSGGHSSFDADGVVDPMRIAALLGLGDPGSRVMLGGALGGAAAAIEDATGARCIVANGPRAAAVETRFDQLVIDDGDAIPLASASLAGLAVDRTTIALLADATRVVRSGGRVIAPVYAPVPDGCRELARDNDEWVAEVEVSASAPVVIQMGRPTTR